MKLSLRKQGWRKGRAGGPSPTALPPEWGNLRDRSDREMTCSQLRGQGIAPRVIRQAPKSGPDQPFPFHLSTLDLGSSPCDEGCRPAHPHWVASEKSSPRASSWIFMFLERKARGEGRETRETRGFLVPHIHLKKGLELGVTSPPSYPLSLSLSLPGSGPQFLYL